MEDSEHKPGQHEPNRSLGLYPWSTDAVGLELSDLVVQPVEIEHSNHALRHSHIFLVTFWLE